MKTKLLILILITFSVNLSRGQMTVNSLTSSEYNTIEINGVLLNTIKNTNGSITQMNSLFGNPNNIIEKGSSINELHRIFIYGLNDGNTIEFSGLSLNQTPSVIRLHTPSIKIKGISVNVQDNITSLPSMWIKGQNNDGSYSILFSKDNGDCCVFTIEYDNSTNLVTMIKYEEFT
ncbi:hypothetical protein SAMN04488096_105196 [Mesonia phycicola]|uniref:Uncharacterized protein n=1 Tax=Mesonia phycicola TaxID=579105 RepID=A0A1M6EQ20_9FLAO|nr:hypothetical protein [Mesonia phycicola]SHI87449.1 hypothetical protein SAMN04488096_105196 [Mesonia phycicola]